MTFSQLASEEERQTLRTHRKVFLGQWERRVVQKPGAGSLEGLIREPLRVGRGTSSGCEAC